MKKTILAVALCALGSIAAQSAWAQSEAKPGYLNSSSGIVRSGTGLCWHTGSWTPAMAVEGCDAVAVVAQADRVVEAIPRGYQPSAPVAERAELDATVHFAFDRAELSAQGMALVDDLAAKALAGDSRVALAIVTGYADRIGSERYNHDLAMRRAVAVANRLASRGVSASAGSVTEKGESEPLVDCPGNASRSTIACLAPNRRVEVVVIVERTAR